MVLVLGILGSPRPRGKAAILLKAFLNGARDAGAETMSIDATRLDISGCTACNGCIDTGECVIDDGMVPVYDAIGKADVVVLATPLYFSGMSSQMKAVIDRCQCLWQAARRGNAGNKSCYLLAVGAREDANFRNVVSEVRSFCIGVGIEYRDGITVPGVDAEGDILTHHEELESAYRMGRSALSRKLTAGSR
jgi:multimeric flavodoxin WrbA